LEYENLRADDAIYRQKILRELDCREKMNASFMYSADEDNGNQRFISILMRAIQDSANGVTAFSDPRFTTPMTIAEVAKMIAGEEIEVPKYDSLGQVIGSEKKRNEVSLDSFYRYLIKEEVIFDTESSRLFWRIIGIAPVKDVVTASGINLGPSPLFWLYYPDLRPVLSKSEVYNPKNVSGRMTWDDLFQSRMFSARIIKTSQDNPKDLDISKYPGLADKPLLQLFEGETIKEKIFNYEQDQWSY
jgi:gliding motility associated protien GldN